MQALTCISLDAPSAQPSDRYFVNGIQLLPCFALVEHASVYHFDQFLIILSIFILEYSFDYHATVISIFRPMVMDLYIHHLYCYYYDCYQNSLSSSRTTL
jgi:hypothetical protein